MFDFFVIVFVISAVILGNNSTAIKHHFPASLKNQLNYLFFFHLLFISLFTYYIQTFGGDSKAYWNFLLPQSKFNKNWFDYYGYGTDFMLFVCYIPSQVFKLSFFTGNFLFGTLGYIGLRYIFILCYTYFPANPKILSIRCLPAMFYLPNIHFWSAGIGKDSLCFWGIAGFIFFMQDRKRNLLPLFIFCAIVFHARPHVAFILMSSALMILFLSTKVSVAYKVIFIVMTGAALFLLTGTLLNYLRLSDLNAETIGNYTNDRISALSRQSVGSSIDIANYSWPARIFSYLFRPLFFDAKNFFSLLSSVENFVYFILFASSIPYWRVRYFKILPSWVKIGLVAFVISTLVFANSLSNLGIIMRMKNMTFIYALIVATILIAIADKLAKRKVSVKKAAGIRSHSLKPI